MGNRSGNDRHAEICGDKIDDRWDLRRLLRHDKLETGIAAATHDIIIETEANRPRKQNERLSGKRRYTTCAVKKKATTKTKKTTSK